MNRKPKSKLPAGWDVYTSDKRQPRKRPGIPRWKYAVWIVTLLVLAGIAFFPWQGSGLLPG